MYAGPASLYRGDPALNGEAETLYRTAATLYRDTATTYASSQAIYGDAATVNEHSEIARVAAARINWHRTMCETESEMACVKLVASRLSKGVHDGDATHADAWLQRRSQTL